MVAQFLEHSLHWPLTKTGYLFTLENTLAICVILVLIYKVDAEQDVHLAAGSPDTQNRLDGNGGRQLIM